MLSGKDRIRKTLLCEATDRPPWVPYVGCHGGYLIGKGSAEYLRSTDLIVQGVSRAIELYKPDGVPVTFDLQIEAEVLGCDLVWADQNPPSVSSHPAAGGFNPDAFRIPGPDEGRIKVVLDAARQLAGTFPDIAFYGLPTGPFTLALHLMGTNIFMAMFDDPEGVKTLLAFCRDVCRAMAGYYLDAGCNVVAVVDPMTSQIGPDQFRDFVTPFISPVFDHVRARGAIGSFFVCGHAQQNIEAMCECRPHNISFDENIPIEYVRDICAPRHISYGGNLQLTTVLLLGKPDDASRNALACLDAATSPGFVLAPGCDLPYNTPPENLQAAAGILLDEYQREAVRAMSQKSEGESLLDMTEYGNADRVIVDIITLDSEACAPCQYMVESVKAVAPEFEGIVQWREHKIKTQESLMFMTALMVKNIPTICIDGRITFVSRIPSREELIEAIQTRIFEKLRMKIKRRRASLFILGDGGETCLQIQKNAEQAILELGLYIETALVTDEKAIATFGLAISQTPAVILARYAVKSTKTIPEPLIIKEWIKDVR